MTGLGPPPNDPQIVATGGVLTALWQAWFGRAGLYLAPAGASGSTANRPVDGAGGVQLWIGQPYWDTSLTKPIWVKSRHPTVWVDATGTPV